VNVGTRAYNGGLGAESPVGSRDRVPGQKVRGAESLLAFVCARGTANLASFPYPFTVVNK